ncbi:MAG: PDZ domain-containing protein [Clostridium sp.]
MPDTEGPERKEPGKREFMREKIVKQPLSKMQIAKRIAAFVCLAAVFGMIAAVSFVLSKPLADRYLGQEIPEESSSIMFTKDEPDPALLESPADGTTAATAQQETQDVEEEISKAMVEYDFSTDNLNSMYNSVREVGQQADKGIVTVRSGRQHMDLFGNPVENTGDYAGIVIAKTSGEYLIFTYADAVKQADSVSVTFFDGTEVMGASKQIDEVLGMAVVSVKTEDVKKDVASDIKVLPLGNSYFAKSGDFIIGVGSPSGVVHSMAYGTISCVVKNVRMIDGMTRILYSDIHSNSRMGTFLLNTAGEVIGWCTDNYKSEDSRNAAVAVGISDYKVTLEKMTNGVPAPYFGVKGQEVNQSMIETGIPMGVYVTEAVSGSPAYDAGIQNGDIITLFGEKKITTFKELQVQIENSESGFSVPVKVMRKSREGYKELDYQVNIRAR